MRRRILGEGRISLKNAIVTCEEAIYNATRQIATNITVELDEETLVQDVDYVVTVNSGGADVGSYSVTIEGIEKYCDIATGTFIISKVTPTVISPVANTLTYDGTELTLASKGVTNYGTLKYSIDNSTWNTEVPGAINANTYTIYYKVEGNNNVNDVPTNSISATIGKVTPTVTAPTAKSLTYNGSAQTLANAGSTNWGTLQYRLGSGSWSTSIPTATNGGSYTVGYRVVGDSNINDITEQTIQCSISEKSISATVTLSQTSYTYSGSECKPTPTVKEGTTVIDPSEYNVTYSNNINAGTGTVTISDKTGGNYNVIGSATFTISKAAGSVTTAPTAKSLTYNGNGQTLANAGSGTGTMYYRLGTSGSFSTTIPSQTNAGSWTLYYYTAESTNYAQSSTGSITVSIAKASQSAPTAYGATTTYNTTATATASGGGGLGSIEWSNGNTQTSVGSKTTYARWSGNSNYNASAWSNGVTLTMNKAGGYVSSAPSNRGVTYNGSNQTLVNAGSGTGTMYYYGASNSSWSTSLPYASAAGSYTIYYYAAESTNYTLSSTGSLTATIGKANLSAPTAYGATVAYNTTATATASGGGGQGSLEWSNGNTQTSVGSKTTKARWAGNSNYNASPYSNEVTLTVKPGEVGHEYVNLGLPSGTKWARTNIGASNEYDMGNSYKYGLGANVYNSSQSNYTGREIPLSSTYDSARQTWGGSWHMPTREQIDELVANTTFSWTTIGGVTGGKLTASNGEYIFFPAGSDLDMSYWSSTPFSTANAHLIRVRSSGIARNNANVKYGLPIRPVVG